MKVHVICCNDAVMYAVIDDAAKAQAKLEELRHEDSRNSHFLTSPPYNVRFYWHIHTVDGE